MAFELSSVAYIVCCPHRRKAYKPTRWKSEVGVSGVGTWGGGEGFAGGMGRQFCCSGRDRVSGVGQDVTGLLI